MVERIYAIYDRQGRHILKGNIPFVMLYPNDAVAVREFTELVLNIPQLRKYPDDYLLACLGTLNTETGLIESYGNAVTPPLNNVDYIVRTARDVLQLQLDLEYRQEQLNKQRANAETEIQKESSSPSSQVPQKKKVK